MNEAGHARDGSLLGADGGGLSSHACLVGGATRGVGEGNTLVRGHRVHQQLSIMGTVKRLEGKGGREHLMTFSPS